METNNLQLNYDWDLIKFDDLSSYYAEVSGLFIFPFEVLELLTKYNIKIHLGEISGIHSDYLYIFRLNDFEISPLKVENIYKLVKNPLWSYVGTNPVAPLFELDSEIEFDQEELVVAQQKILEDVKTIKESQNL